MTNPNSIPKWKKKLPMIMTLSRIAVSPVFVVLLPLNQTNWNWVAAGVFLLASLTDYFDGYFARKYDAISNFGKFMDPIADKILVAAVLIMLIPSGRVDPLLVLLLLVRDILIGGIRSIAAADQIIIDAKPAGKWKTALQMLSIPAVLVGAQQLEPGFHGQILALLYDFGYGALWLSVALSLLSAYQYTSLYFEKRKPEV